MEAFQLEKTMADSLSNTADPPAASQHILLAEQHRKPSITERAIEATNIGIERLSQRKASGVFASSNSLTEEESYPFSMNPDDYELKQIIGELVMALTALKVFENHVLIITRAGVFGNCLSCNLQAVKASFN